ncbi:hypothetical protein ZEAMMB73_Zm00001d017360 [Zea mays]|nr:hypothetical protein ZEAMMB73_Zm00001d017360 [Zea mays]AQK72991.1 hypothetical protein ZEAMMB73_Zm00001d017360 [Zea mays]
MNSKRRRSHSPVEYKEGRDKDYGTSGKKDKSRDLDDTCDARRGHETDRHSDKHSFGTSRESKKHDDYRRYHDKYGDDYGRSHPRASRSDRESRADTYYDRSKHDNTSGRSRGDQRDVGSRYGEKSVNRDQRSINEGKQESPRGYQKNDGGEYNKHMDARKQEYKGYGDDRDHYRVVRKNKETIKEEEDSKRRNGKEIEKEALVETRDKKRSLFSSTGPNVDNPGDVKLSSATNEALDNAAETVDGVNAAKVAAMKAAELVNRNIAAFGAGTGRLSTDQKKKLLWGNKTSNPSEETSKRWDLFSDRERQEKFNKLMVIPSLPRCEEQCPSSGKHGREQGRELGGRSQETGGARHQPGETLHSRPPQERWQDSRPWPVETLLAVADAAALKNAESLLCTIYSALFILALTKFPVRLTLTVSGLS